MEKVLTEAEKEMQRLAREALADDGNVTLEEAVFKFNRAIKEMLATGLVTRENLADNPICVVWTYRIVVLVPMNVARGFEACKTMGGEL